MSIAISDDHQALGETVAELLGRRESLKAARALLEGSDETSPAWWKDAVELGWLGLHLPEDVGGSGYTLEELVVVVEQFGRGLATGAFVPTVIASATIAAAGSDDVKAAHLAGLADGSVVAAVGLSADATLAGDTLSGSADAVVGAGLADLIVLPVGDDAVIVATGDGVTVDVPANMDPTRRSGRVTFAGAAATVIPGGAQALVDHARTIFSAEAVGIARECTEQAAEYAKARIQFGRPIAMFQAVKHHCSNMLVQTEMATGAVWDAARAAADGGAPFSLAAAMAATLAIPAADFCAQHNIQVHGGIGYTWEHDAHLYLRRASALDAIVNAAQAGAATTDTYRRGARREKTVDLPPEAEAIRDEVRAFAESVKDLDAAGQRKEMIAQGYAMPHWPAPYGRAAGAVEQLVIEQEFAAAGVQRPQYGITGWVILTLIQYATPEQVSRWVTDALNQDVIWCQLFSEPDAGSDAAGVKTRATRVDGGWLINGQKVWTSGAHLARFGFATVRTNPDVPKHQGITTVVIDMKADGVEVRPLKMPTGGSEFNEVFFNDVFVPDDDVIGPVDGGWTVARATLGNESVSIGGGQGGASVPGEAIIPLYDAHPERLAGGAARLGRYIALTQAIGLLNLRSAHRAVAGGAPGPEGNITKLVLSENGHEAAAILHELAGPAGAYLDGSTVLSGTLVLAHRALSIAGGTSEIKRNQIAERILGLPRDPLIK